MCAVCKQHETLTYTWLKGWSAKICGNLTIFGLIYFPIYVGESARLHLVTDCWHWLLDTDLTYLIVTNIMKSTKVQTFGAYTCSLAGPHLPQGYVSTRMCPFTTCTRGGSACVFFRIAKNDQWYSTMREVPDLCNGAVSEKTPQIFWLSLPVEYVTSISRWKDAPNVRCDLTDRHTDTDRQTNYSNPRCACAQRIKHGQYFNFWHCHN